MILQFSSALCVQPSTETVKRLPSFQIVFGGKIEWFDHSNLKAMTAHLVEWACFYSNLGGCLVNRVNQMFYSF